MRDAYGSGPRALAATAKKYEKASQEAQVRTQKTPMAHTGRNSSSNSYSPACRSQKTVERTLGRPAPASILQANGVT
jgi:hypothetical protein